MAKHNFTFGYNDYPALDGAGNIVLVGDPPHVVIPIQPIPFIYITARNMHWRYLNGVLKITVNGVEREFHYTEGHTDSSMPADLGTIYIEEYNGGLVGWDIYFKAFTINKSVQICQLSVSIEPECLPYDTYPIQWEVSLHNVGIHEAYLEDVYACLGSGIHLMDMQVDTQSRTGWIETHKGVDPDKRCESCGGGDEPEPPPPPPNLPETVYVTGKWEVTETLSDGTTYKEGGQLTPYSATLTVLEDGYLYEGTGGENNFVESRDNGETWTVSSDDNPHPKIMYPSVTKSGGPEGVYEYSYSEDVGGGTIVSEFIQFTVSALGVDEMFE